MRSDRRLGGAASPQVLRTFLYGLCVILSSLAGWLVFIRRFTRAMPLSLSILLPGCLYLAQPSFFVANFL
jgi:hypothetical protein